MSDIAEMVEILDAQGKVTGVLARDEAERLNHATPNALVLVFTPAGEAWIQLRPKTKKHYPGRWDISACGGIMSGETPAQAAAREQAEEMGISSELHFVETFMNEFAGDHGEVRRRLSHLYISVSNHQPRTGPEADEFRAVPHAQLRAEAQMYPERFIPPLITELDRAVKAYQAL